MFEVDLSQAKSVEDILNILKNRIDVTKSGKWVEGFGWNPLFIEEKHEPTKYDLDKISPNNPVIIFRVDLHSAVANSIALKLANITADTPQPYGGTIDKSKNTGEPTGILIEEPAISIVKRIIPPKSITELKESIKKTNDDFISEGITTCKDMVQIENKKNILQAYKELDENGQLSVRTCLLYEVSNSSELENIGIMKLGKSDMLKFNGVKIWFDGSIPSRTGWMYDEWNKNYNEKDVGNYGSPTIPQEELGTIVEKAHGMGFQIGVHATCDKAIDVTLDSLEETLMKNPRKNCRHSIIHCHIPTDIAIERIVKLGSNIVIETQSVFLYSIGNTLASNLGLKRSRRVQPLRTLIERGVIVGNSSDSPVGHFQPRYGLWSAVNRKTSDGQQPFGTEESLSIEEALKTYTLYAARCVFMEDQIGSIEKGKNADLVVWDKSPFDMHKNELKNLKVVMTIVDGNVVYKL